MWQRSGRPQVRAQRRERQLRAAAIVAEARHHEAQRLPAIGMRPAAAARRQPAQPGGAVVREVTLLGVGLGVRIEQQAAVLGDEQEEQPVDQAQQLPVVVLLAERAGGQCVAQRAVLRMRQEALAEGLDRGLDAVAEPLERTGPLLLRRLHPALEPALGRALGLDPRLVQHQPQDGEVRVGLTFQHGLEVELDVSLAREARVVAQEAQAQAVAEDGPEMRVAAVQQLLHEAVRALARGAGHAGAAAIEIRAKADQVDRRVVPVVRDGDGAAREFDPAAGRQQPAVAEFLEERQQPTLAREPRVRSAVAELRAGLAEARPRAEQPVPRARHRLAEPRAGLEVVVRRGEARQLAVAGGDALQQLRRQQTAFAADRLEEGARSSAHGGFTAPPGAARRSRGHRPEAAARRGN
ncbi:MAG: hypothetical protein M5U32_19155 [Myxococcota bacterium]|nr:hypothetical protein [Myxococcota bacterium]